MSNNYPPPQAAANANDVIPLPPDITHQDANNRQDLLQDVTQSKEQPDLTKGGGTKQNIQEDDRHHFGEPEKVECDLIIASYNITIL